MQFPSALHQESAIPQLFDAFKGSGYCLESLLDSKEEVVTQQLHDQKPWPVCICLCVTFYLGVRVHILVVNVS